MLNHSQQVDRNIFVRVWSEVRGFLRCFFGCCQGGNQTDGTNAFKRSWRCLFSFVRKLFARPAPQPQPPDEEKIPEKIVIPRVRLPSNELQLEYKMNHTSRGVAMIFNHEIFGMQDKPKRVGSDKDRDRLKNLLTRLHFDVHVLDDFTLREIKEELGKVAAMDHTHHDCLLITFMTHGDDRTISSYDRDYKIDLITKYFTDTRCPTLEGKPRLFFIQACRGSGIDHGLSPDQHREHMKDLQIRRQNRRRRKGNDHTDAVPDDDDPGREIEQMVHNPPIYQDFLIVRSTMPGFFSFRNTDSGSWFIQEFCNELEENGVCDNLMHVLTRVNYRVSMRESRAMFLNGKKQILCISSMLTKVLIFNMKREEEDDHPIIPY